MRITAVTLFKADIPLKDPFRIAVMEMRAAANVFVRVSTDSGLVGRGESSPFWKLCGETQNGSGGGGGSSGSGSGNSERCASALAAARDHREPMGRLCASLDVDPVKKPSDREGEQRQPRGEGLSNAVSEAKLSDYLGV
jgi:hypothetical protein